MVSSLISLYKCQARWRNHGETDDPAAGRPVSLDYEEDKVVVVIMAGTRGNFYEQLKRYMK